MLRRDYRRRQIRLDMVKVVRLLGQAPDCPSPRRVGGTHSSREELSFTASL